MLNQLVYVSEKSNVFRGREDLDDILERAHKVNPALGLTGVLLYRSGHFVQLLEGEPESIKKLFSKVSKDPRHKNVQTIMNQPAKNRIFGEWSMAFRELQDSDLSKFSKLSSWDHFVEACNRGDQIPPDFLQEVLIEFRYKAA